MDDAIQGCIARQRECASIAPAWQFPFTGPELQPCATLAACRANPSMQVAFAGTPPSPPPAATTLVQLQRGFKAAVEGVLMAAEATRGTLARGALGFQLLHGTWVATDPSTGSPCLALALEPLGPALQSAAADLSPDDRDAVAAQAAFVIAQAHASLGGCSGGLYTRPNVCGSHMYLFANGTYAKLPLPLHVVMATGELAPCDGGPDCPASKALDALGADSDLGAFALKELPPAGQPILRVDRLSGCTGFCVPDSQ